jgi:hypothetical protein
MPPTLTGQAVAWAQAAGSDAADSNSAAKQVRNSLAVMDSPFLVELKNQLTKPNVLTQPHAPL